MAQSSLDLDPASSPEELAAAISVLPDGTDLGSDAVGKLEKTLLTGTPPEQRNPAKYAQIFDFVRRNHAVTPWMRFAAWAESVNGRRRMKGANMAAIAGELGDLMREAAENIPNDPYKYALLGGIAYNRGIVCRGLRQYAEEALAQRESASWYGFAGNPAKSDTSLFASQVGAVSAAFVAGDDDKIWRACEALVALRDFVKCQAYPYPAWMVDNAPIHIGFALMMVSFLDIVPISELDELAGKESENVFEAGRRVRSDAWKKAFETWHDYDERFDDDAVISAIPVDAPSSSLDNSTLTIRILVARATERKGDADGARKILTEVVNHEGPDGGIPIAVAKKLLAS